MSLDLSLVTVKNILTRTTGFLRNVTSHSLQPYRGCTFGKALCGVGCYVQHSRHITQGRPWGNFLEVRTNAAQSYLANCDRERRWVLRRNRSFSIFCASATDPFLPQEFQYGITRQLLEVMCDEPPDELVLQTHSHRVIDYCGVLAELSRKCQLRVHVSIETDRARIAGLPPHASPIERRLETCRKLREAGLLTVVTVAPLLPIADPKRFFARIAEVADAVVLDHFIEGDGSTDGTRTQRTELPQAMSALDPQTVSLNYRDKMAACAREFMPGRVGVNVSGFAGRYE